MGSYFVICYVHPEHPSFVIWVESTVKEVLRESQIDHAVVLPHDRIHSVVHQIIFLVIKIIEHAL